MWTKRFWVDAVERAVRAGTGAALTALGTTAAIQHVDWGVVAGAAGIGALVSVLTSLAASRRGDSESASLTR